MGMTVVEKILARASGYSSLKAGDVVEPKVDLAMSHENAALVINQFLEIYDGTSVTPKVLGPLEGCPDLRSPCARGVLKDRDEPEESTGICRQVCDQQIP